MQKRSDLIKTFQVEVFKIFYSFFLRINKKFWQNIIIWNSKEGTTLKRRQNDSPYSIVTSQGNTTVPNL